jgi:DNA-binding MarR family transcriptional regulator
MADESVLVEERLLKLLPRLRKLGPGCLPFEDIPVTPPQSLLLDWVAGAPGCGIQEMAAGLGLTAPTVSVGVRRLEEAGLLEREPNPRDRRSLRLFLTAQGQKVQRLLAGLTPQERETLLDLLERAINVAEES